MGKQERARAEAERLTRERKVRAAAAKRRGRVRMAMENVGWGREKAVTLRIEGRVYEPSWMSYRRLLGWRIAVEVGSQDQVEELLERLEKSAADWVEEVKARNEAEVSADRGIS